MRKVYRFQPLLFAAVLMGLLGIHSLHAQQDTWLRSFGSGLADTPEDILVDDAGNSYISGYFRDTLRFGTTELISRGKTDVFLAKFAPDGNWLGQTGMDGIRMNLRTAWLLTSLET